MYLSRGKRLVQMVKNLSKIDNNSKHNEQKPESLKDCETDEDMNFSDDSLIDSTFQYDSDSNDTLMKTTNNVSTPYCTSVSDFYATDEENNIAKVVVLQNKKNRWRTQNQDKWKPNISKNRRSLCLPYDTKKGVRAAKLPKPVDCTKCKFHCITNIEEDERLKICKFYWGLNSYCRQKDFILKYVESVIPKRKTGEFSSRSQSRSYYFSNAQGQQFRVCSNFFQKTLCISNGPINMAFEKKNGNGCFGATDNRGRKTPGNKTNNDASALIKEHIESFPITPAHYVRKTSSRNYLDSSLSILKMYALYEEFSQKRNKLPVSSATYRRYFCMNFNFSFYKPKKDQCSTCTKFKLADTSKKEEIKHDYELHMKRKADCMEAKNSEKHRASIDPSFQAVTFDLQSVLQIPSTDASLMYYSRKINVYNLTVYEEGHEQNGLCYFWNEINGKRGSSEIGSILYKYVASLPESITELSMYSDTCGGQNRNQHVAAILIHAIRNTNLNIIEHKFLESGHSYMECDSMHSAIEQSKKNKSVFMMKDWKDIFVKARSKRGKNKTKNPYIVQEIKFEDFYDLKDLSSKIIKNRNIDEHGDVVCWLKIKCLKYEKKYPDTIFYRYDHTSIYKKIDINLKKNIRNRNIDVKLKSCYGALLPISLAKKNDLVKLCHSGVIPDELHPWYFNLPTKKNVADVLEVDDSFDSE